MDDRIIKLIGNEKLKIIKESNVLLIGVGGVGGFVFESLVRSGFRNITIIDGDRVEESNLNRQIISLTSNIGLNKVDVALKRALDINHLVNIKAINKFLVEEDITYDAIKGYDYIIDACDTVVVKKALLNIASNHNIRIISCMGTANRIDPTKITFKKLKDTNNDPLAKVLRHELRDNKKAMNCVTVCSEELPIKQKELGTLVMVPMAAASLIVSKVIRDIIQ